MTNLTPSEARRLIDKLHHNQTKEHGISILEEKYLAALEIALTVLERQESKRQVTLREAFSELRNLNDKSGGYNFEALRAEQDNSDWISCSERMPELYVAVNFWVMGSVENDICESAYNGYWDGEVWHQDATLTGYDNSPMVRSCVEVTHWMPLPAPPQPQTDTYRQIENDAWIEWSGGECPVDKNAKVEFKSPGGAAGLQRAKYLNWFHNGAGDDIIAYRVIENNGREG